MIVFLCSHCPYVQHIRGGLALGTTGDGVCFAGDNAGAQALVAAAHALTCGAVDSALVVAYDSLLEPETLVEIGESRAGHLGGVSDLASPYDVAARGFVPGEAAAAVVLQREGEALVTVTEAAGPNAMTRVVERLGPAAIVDGAAQANRERDDEERRSLAAACGETTPLCALSASMGELGASKSIVQLIALREALARGRVPAIAGLRNAADGPLRPLLDEEATSASSAMGVAATGEGFVAGVRVELS